MKSDARVYQYIYTALKSPFDPCRYTYSLLVMGHHFMPCVLVVMVKVRPALLMKSHGIEEDFRA